MAKILGMSQTGYSKYETGENDMPTSILIKLTHYHNTSVDYLLGLTDEKAPYKVTNHQPRWWFDVGPTGPIILFRLKAV